MRYQVSCDRIGGEYCVGSVSKETMGYWSTKDINDLKEHLLSDTILGVPQEHNLYPFYEHDNLIHANGVEVNQYNRLTVTDLDTEEEVYIFDLDIKELANSDNSWIINDKDADLSPNEDTIVTGSIEKGTWIYEEFELNETFDPKKLQLFMYAIDTSEGLYVVDHMAYEDIDISHVDGSAMGKDFIVYFDAEVETE